MSGSADAVKVTVDNYKANLSMLWAQALVIRDAPLGEMIAAAEHAEAVGPIVDPTAYRRKGRALHEDLEMLYALKHVQDVVESIARRKVRAAGVDRGGVDR